MGLVGWIQLFQSWLECHAQRIKKQYIPQGAFAQKVADPYKKVDQLLWIVSDLNKTILGWKRMGFSEVIRLDTLTGYSQKNSSSFKLLCAKANLGGAQVTWIQPIDLNSLFANFHSVYGDGVMGIVQRKMGERRSSRVRGV